MNLLVHVFTHRTHVIVFFKLLMLNRHISTLRNCKIVACTRAVRIVHRTLNICTYEIKKYILHIEIKNNAYCEMNVHYRPVNSKYKEKSVCFYVCTKMYVIILGIE